MIQIDARGKACPQPVIMTKNALVENPEQIETIVDNPEASQNVSRFLKSKGYSVAVAESGKDFTVKGTRTGASEIRGYEDIIPPVKSHNAVFISHNKIGGNDEELGEVLMKAFLGTLVQYDDAERPALIALMNEGVKLAVAGTSSAETLQEFVEQGGTVLVCGTCLKHFGLMEKLGVGTVSNMFEIASALLKSNTLSL